MSKFNWSYELLKDMCDPANQIISNDIGIVMKDKYPKAMHHYLVLPKDDIPSIFYLRPSHLDLLSELYLLASNIIEVKKLQKENFKIGFHAIPSMQRLHMHVISKDFVSPGLKTRKHWNSFNTKLFLPFDELIDNLKKNGKIDKIGSECLEELHRTELKCNQCSSVSKTMPDLKNHLTTHLSKE